MSLLSALWSGDLQASTPGPTDDFWYGSAGGVLAASGQRVDPEAAQKLSAWYRGRDILATVLAMLPLALYRRLPNDEGSEVAREHPLYDVLHTQPNGWQDSFLWRRQKMYHLIDHGNGYDWIRSGGRGVVDRLEPISDPRLVTPEQVGSSRVVYHVRDPKSGRTQTYPQEALFHICGASDDGIVGKGVLKYARDSVGIALAVESYAGRLFSQGSLSGGVLTVPGILNDEASVRMAKSWTTSQAEWHLPKIAEQGAVFTESTMSAEDHQMLLSRKHSVDDVARWLGIPRMMLENSDPSYGNAEQFNENFLVYSMGGWLSLFEFAINRQLVLAPKLYYAEFTRDAIARALFAARAAANVAYVNAGIFTVDEVRAKEGRNKRGGKADELREPQNITGRPTVPSSAQNPASEQARAVLASSAARILRKEVEVVGKLAVKHAKSADAFAAAVADFYAKHMSLVMEALGVDAASAGAYCAEHAAGVLANARILETWATEDGAAAVADWALGMEWSQKP